jgi:hypothetical protein
MWHKRRCLLGECQDCGVLKKLLFCPSELNPHLAALVKWRRFEKVEVGINLDSGDLEFIVQEVYKETIPFEPGLLRGRFQTDGRSDNGRGGVRDLDAL